MIRSRTTDITGNEADLPDSSRALQEAMIRAASGSVIPTDERDTRDLTDSGIKLAGAKLAL